MLITYEFNFEGGNQRSFPVDTDRTRCPLIAGIGCAREMDGTGALSMFQLSLKEDKVKYCPAALDLQDVIVAFKKRASVRRVDVKVVAPNRSYTKRTGLEGAYGP